jgi:hypothetical protein
VNRQQLLLRSVDVEKLVEEDHPVRAIWELVDGSDLESFYETIEAVEGEAGGQRVGAGDLQAAVADCGISPCLDQREVWPEEVSGARFGEGPDRGLVGLFDLQYLSMDPSVLEAPAGGEGWELSSRKGD